LQNELNYQAGVKEVEEKILHHFSTAFKTRILKENNIS